MFLLYHFHKSFAMSENACVCHPTFEVMILSFTPGHDEAEQLKERYTQRYRGNSLSGLKANRKDMPHKNAPDSVEKKREPENSSAYTSELIYSIIRQV